MSAATAVPVPLLLVLALAACGGAADSHASAAAPPDSTATARSAAPGRAGPTPTDSAFRTYRNTRFDYRVDVPHFLHAGSAPANGDGRAFRSDDGAVVLRVAGSHAPAVLQGWSAADAVRDSIARPTYVDTLTDGAVASGYAADGGVVYRRILGPHDGDRVLLTVRYPPEHDGRVG